MIRFQKGWITGFILFIIFCSSLISWAKVTKLPEVVVKSDRMKYIHILAYVREISTLSSYSDTITLFREKIVDFMLPPGKKSSFRGWTLPRIINSESYYRFTNSHGLDSVSKECHHHFSWADWMGVFPVTSLPNSLELSTLGKDTLHGKYSPAIIWTKANDRVTLDINVLADTIARRWIPNVSLFFNKNLDFEKFRLHINYDNVISHILSPLDLDSYSFDIDSNGRGHNFFRFTHRSQPVYVNTHADVYILDREFIPIKEAKQWAKLKLEEEKIEIIRPIDAPPLSDEVTALIYRTEHIDKDGVRLKIKPDPSLGSTIGVNRNFNFGYRLLNMFKDFFGITAIRAHRKRKQQWNEFLRECKDANKARLTPEYLEELRDTIPK